MPVGKIAGKVAEGLFRLLGQFLADVIGELLVRGVGYAIWQRVSPDADPDGWPSAIVGMLFWVMVFALGYLAYQHAAGWLAVDKCLDSGDSYNYESGSCIHG